MVVVALKSCNYDNVTLAKSRNYDDLIHCEVVALLSRTGQRR